MKIIFVAPFMTALLRGIERVVFEVGTRLALRGHQVHILYWPGSHPWPYGPVPPGFYLHELPLPRYYQHRVAGLFYPLYFRRIKPDVVSFFYSWHGEDIAHRYWRDRRPASILMVHYPAQEVPSRYEQLASSRVIRRATALVACSDYVAAGVRDLLRREPATIRNGVDVDRFVPADAATKRELRHQLGLEEQRPILCTVGALEERKGVGRALEAMSLLHQRGIDFMYIVVGEGKLHSELERFVAGHDLSGTVMLVGAHADPRPFYQVADLFLFLSRGEAAPLAPLEAMACALPIVAANQPPLDELLPPGGTIFVDERAPAMVCDALTALLQDPATMRAMGDFNRTYARATYSWETIVDQYESLYRRIVT